MLPASLIPRASLEGRLALSPPRRGYPSPPSSSPLHRGEEEDDDDEEEEHVSPGRPQSEEGKKSGVWLGVVDRLGVAAGELLREGDLAGVSEGETEGVREVEGVMLGVSEGERLGVREGVVVRVGVDELDGCFELEGETRTDGLALREGVGDLVDFLVGEGVKEMVGVTEGVLEADLDGERVGVNVRVGDGEAAQPEKRTKQAFIFIFKAWHCWRRRRLRRAYRL